MPKRKGDAADEPRPAAELDPPAPALDRLFEGPADPAEAPRADDPAGEDAP